MNNTLTNGLLVLEYLANTGAAYSVSEIAAAFSLPKSHACRLLKTLTDSGHVEQDAATRKYRISLKILTLSHACLMRLEIRTKLRPFLKKLVGTLGQPVFLQVPLEASALIIDAEYPDAARTDAGLVIGGRNPIHASAGGKLCAAHMAPEQLDALLQSVTLERLGERTITDPELLKEELARIRTEGVSVMDDERMPDLGAVAAPVFNCEEAFVAALGVVLPQGKNPPSVWERFKKETMAAADAASYALGYGLKRLV